MHRLPYTLAWSRGDSLGRRAEWIVFRLSLAWLGGLAWMRPLALPDEGRYVGVAWEMFRSNDWITPTLDGLPFFHKPPLFYWITAAAMHLFGPGEWAARCAPIASASVTVTILYVVCREWLGEKTAAIAALVLATQPLFFGGAQFANMDMLVAACISAAILFGARAALRFEAGQERRGDLARAAVALALGVLAKGLIGLLIPILVLLIWLGLVRHWRTVRALVWLPGAAIFAVIATPWFAAVQWEHPGFAHYFFVVQHLQRFAGGGFNNVQPFWFYVPVLFLFTLPWSGWLLGNLRQSSTAQSSRPAVLSLMCVWLVVVLGFFSLPQSKPVGYILPALVPLAVLVALTAAPLVQRSERMRTAWRASLGAAVAVCVAVTVGFTVSHPKSSRSLAQALAAHAHSAGNVVLLDEYRYDVPFYLRSASPVTVVANWNAADVQLHDNWRKELADAGDFAPAAATDRLIDEAAFHSALCAGRVQWVIADREVARRFPFLDAAEILATERSASLWRLDAANRSLRAALACNVVRTASGLGR